MMIRMSFLFVFAVQFCIVILAACFVYALVFNPEAIGAAVARIIIGFQQALGGAA